MATAGTVQPWRRLPTSWKTDHGHRHHPRRSHHQPRTGRSHPIDVDAVAALLTEAFDEPVTRRLVPGSDRRQLIVTGLIALIAADVLITGGRIDIFTDENDRPVAAAIRFDHSTHEGGPTSGPDPRFPKVFRPFAQRRREIGHTRCP